MARRTSQAVPEPPWTWGPSEVNAWIRGAYPASKGTKKETRRGPVKVAVLRFVADGIDRGRLARAVSEAAASSGVVAGGLVLRVRRGLASGRHHGSVRFHPPVQPATCKRILEALLREVRLTDVETKSVRTRIPGRRS